MGRHRKSHHELPKRVYRHGTSYIFVPLNGKPINLGSELVTALAKYAQLIDPVREFRTMGEVIDGYMRDVAPLKAPRTYKDNLVEAKNLKAVFGNILPEQLVAKPSYIYRYRRERGAPVRANREISLLSSIFSYAIEQGAVESNPCKMVRRAAGTEKKRTRYVDHWERRKFAKEYCPKWLRAYILLKYLIGLRQADMLKLGKQHMNERGISIKTGKTGKPMHFRWTRVLRIVVGVILADRRRQDTMQLFVSRRAKPLKQSGFKSQWQRSMQAWEKDGHERFWEHDIRAKMVSDSKTIAEAQERAGHDSARTTMSYRRAPVKVRPLR